MITITATSNDEFATMPQVWTFDSIEAAQARLDKIASRGQSQGDTVTSRTETGMVTYSPKVRTTSTYVIATA